MKDLFDENGFAVKDCRVNVSIYDEKEKEFLGTQLTHVSGGFGIPGNTTLVEALELKDGFTQVFDEESQTWSYVEDHRYSDVYNIHTKQKEEIRYIGALKDEHTLLAPPSFNHDFIDGAWIITEEKKSELEAQEKQQKIIEFEAQIKHLEKELLIAGMRGKDISEIIAELDVLEAELEYLK